MRCLWRDNRKLELGLGSPISVYRPSNRDREQLTIPSAHGRAYLAFCNEAERQSLLDLLRRSGNPENDLAFRTEKLNRILAEIRRRGYATRDASFVGGFYGRPPYSDGLTAIAVPVRRGGQVYGAVNIVWLQSAHSVDHMVRRHLADLQAAASQIAAGMPRRPRQIEP